jgi:hypothetical protein
MKNAMSAFRPLRATAVFSAAIAAGVMLFAATEPAQAFKRGPVMRPMAAQPMIAKPYRAMSDVGYTVTVTDTQTGRVRRHLTGFRNANTSDPGNVEVVLKVLDGRPVHTMRPGKFRVVEREQLQLHTTRPSNFRGVDQVYIPTR